MTQVYQIGQLNNSVSVCTCALAQVAQLMSAMCLREALALVRTVLWLLGTRLGTLALCGARCLSSRFPFVRSFAEMPVERREDALRRWSRETVFPPLRLFFLLVKVYCLYVFYSWVSKLKPAQLVLSE